MTDLIEKCPPAAACRDAFDRMSRATIAMCQSTTGFGAQVKYSLDLQDQSPIGPPVKSQLPLPFERSSRPPPTFDYNLKDLFPDQATPTAPTFADGWQFPSNPVAPMGYPAVATSANNMPLTGTSSPAVGSEYDPRLFLNQNKAQSRRPLPIQQQSLGLPNNPLGPTFGFSPNIDLTNLPDFDFLSQDDTSATSSGAYHNNLGFEGDHRDFEDGDTAVPDLFGGFFFGGPTSVGGEMDIDGLSSGSLQNFDGILTGPTVPDERTLWGASG